MRKTIVGILLAATAVTPTIASAQDTDQARQGHWREGREARGERWQQPQGQRAYAQPQVQAQTQVQAQAQAQVAPPQQEQRRAGWNGERRWNGGQDGNFRANSGEARQDGRWQRSGIDQARQGYAPSITTQQPYGGDRRGYAGQGYDRDPRTFGQRDGRGYEQRNDRDYGRRDDRDQGRRDYGQGNQWQHGYGDQRWNGRDGARSAQTGQWNRGWRGDNRYDWSRYRQSNRGAYHLPRYYAPSNWQYGYRRFSPGITLSSILFGSNYWIQDPYDYRLPAAYGPYRWVRYYNDALLVDIRTGYVVDTVYDIFW